MALSHVVPSRAFGGNGTRGADKRCHYRSKRALMVELS